MSRNRNKNRSARNIVAPLCILLLVSTGAFAQQPADVTAPGEKKSRQHEVLIASIKEALRKRLSYAGQPQFERERADGGEAGGDWFDPQSGRAPRRNDQQPAAEKSHQLLTAEDVVNLVDLYHPKLRGADAERRIASAKRLEKQGAFDPVFFTGTDYLRFNTEFDGKLQRGNTGTARVADAGVEYLTRYGVKVGAGARFNLGKIKSPLSPTGDGGEYFMEFKIPFLRGARINEKSAAERQAFLGEPLADAEYQIMRLDLILKAMNAYWDWVAAKRKLDLARQLLQLAEFRASAVRERVEAGDLPRIDSAEADLETQRRQGAVVKADRDLQKAAFKLSLFLWSPNGLPAQIPEEGNVPATMPPPVGFDDEKAVAGQRLAIERRPELRVISLNRDIAQVDLDLARNQRLPAVDLSFSPGRDTGFGGVGNTIKASLNITLPMRQRAADGRAIAATLKMEKLDLDLASERQRILTETLDAISAINAAHNRYRAAEQEVELARQLEEGERTKFALGDSTLFLVNQRERATAEAKVKLIEVQAEYEQAVAAFRAATAQY